MKIFVWLIFALMVLSLEMLGAQAIASNANKAALANAINEYFSVEIYTSIGKIILAITIFAVGVLIWKRSNFCKGLAGFLWFVALVEIIVGSTVYLRTEKQVSDLLAQLKTSPSDFLSEEIARMTTIVDNFVGFQNLQIGVILLGIAFVLVGRFKNWEILTGLGVGQISMGAALYLIDYPAVQSADVYLATLESAKF